MSHASFGIPEAVVFGTYNWSEVGYYAERGIVLSHSKQLSIGDTPAEIPGNAISRRLLDF